MTFSVWDEDHKRTEKRYVKGKERNVTTYLVTCKNIRPDGRVCNNERYLTKSDAQRAGKCFQCSQIEKAPKGFKGLVQKHGPKIAVEKLQAYRLTHPSPNEQRVMRELTLLGIHFEREVWLQDAEDHVYLIDFVINGCHAIEVNGEWIHEHHKARDQRKYNEIRSAGYRLLVLTERDLPNASVILSVYLNLPIPAEVVVR